MRARFAKFAPPIAAALPAEGKLACRDTPAGFAPFEARSAADIGAAPPKSGLLAIDARGIFAPPFGFTESCDPPTRFQLLEVPFEMRGALETDGAPRAELTLAEPGAPELPPEKRGTLAADGGDDEMRGAKAALLPIERPFDAPPFNERRLGDPPPSAREIDEPPPNEWMLGELPPDDRALDEPPPNERTADDPPPKDRLPELAEPAEPRLKLEPAAPSLAPPDDDSRPPPPRAIAPLTQAKVSRIANTAVPKRTAETRAARRSFFEKLGEKAFMTRWLLCCRPMSVQIAHGKN